MDSQEQEQQSNADVKAIQSAFFDRYLFRVKPVRFLIALNRGTKVIEFYHKEKVTYFYMYGILKKFKQNRLLKIEKEGRENKVIMTKKGKKVAEMLEGLIQICK